MKAMVCSMWSKLEETINYLVENVLVSVDQWIQSRHEKLYAKADDTRLGLQVVMFVDTSTSHHK